MVTIQAQGTTRRPQFSLNPVVEQYWDAASFLNFLLASKGQNCEFFVQVELHAEGAESGAGRRMDPTAAAQHHG
jgi:hypothetical protein